MIKEKLELTKKCISLIDENQLDKTHEKAE